MKPIYVVNCYYLENKTFSSKVKPQDFKRKREWGFYHNKEQALKVIQENITDIYEDGYYNLAMLEERFPGVASSHLDKHFWFDVVFNSDTQTYDINFISKCFLEKDYSYNFQTRLEEVKE